MSMDDDTRVMLTTTFPITVPAGCPVRGTIGRAGQSTGPALRASHADDAVEPNGTWNGP
jgi:hypothetical protein